MKNFLLILAQEGGEHAEEPSGLDLILPDTAELVWGIVCFAIVATFLMWKVFPKLRETIEARENTIQEALESAESSKAEAQSQLDEYKRQLAEARSEANRIIEEARQSAEQVRKDLTAKAERDAEAIVARAQEQIEAERDRTVQELQSSISDITIELAEKVVGRSLDGDTQRQMVDAYIREVSGMGGQGSSN
jgi:F-type H+-transporting ATPase subunit b